MTSWQDSKAWSDRFVHEIKGIVGQCLIGTDPVEDMHRNTDLIVLNTNIGRVACRIRSWGYIKYSDEFTIRVDRPSGQNTELGKILAGWGDHFFYGFADQNTETLAAWFIGDLYAFRAWHGLQLAQLPRGSYPGAQRKNGDGSSSFRAFRHADIPGFITTHRHRIPWVVPNVPDPVLEPDLPF